MKSALIITVGTRDLTINKEDFIQNNSPEDWDKIFDVKRNGISPKLGGEVFEKQFNQLHPVLKYPIIKPALKDVIRKNGQIDKIILIATDQKESGEQFTANDTFIFARILQKLLVLKHGKNLANENPVAILTVDKNVSYLDSMVDFFNNKKKTKSLLELIDFENIYVLNQGGIPSINMALMLKTIDLYGSKTIFLRTNEEDGQCYPLKFTMQFLESDKRKTIKTALNNYNYNIIAETTTDPSIALVSKYALHRLYFDFESASDFLKALRTINPDLSKRLLKGLNEITADHLSLIKEVYINAKIKLKQQAYVDFLLRAFRITEEYTRTRAMKKLDFPFNHYTFEKDISAFLQKPENRALLSYLENENFKGSKLKYTTPTIPVFIAIAGFYEPNVLDKLNKITALSEVRNKSIGAHDFEPVSLEIIEKALAERQTSLKEVLNDFDEILGMESNPFDEINKEIAFLLDVH